MSKPFMVIAGGWVIGVLISAPALIESFRRNGMGASIPGLSPVTSEVVVTLMFAVIPPLLAASLVKARRGKDR